MLLLSDVESMCFHLVTTIYGLGSVYFGIYFGSIESSHGRRLVSTIANLYIPLNLLCILSDS